MGKWMFEEVFGGGAFSGVYDILNVALLGGSKYSNATDLIKNIYQNVMVPIALSLLVIYFVCTLIEKSTNEQFTYEQMFLLFAKMIVAVFLIDKGYDLMMKFQEVGLGFLNSFHTVASDKGLTSGSGAIANDDNLKALYKAYLGVDYPNEPGWIDGIKNLISGRGITLLLAWVFSFVVKIAVYLIVFMRILEVFLRTMFAPVALSDVFYNGLNSTGFRFLKNYLAVSMQIVVIYGCVILYNVLMADIATGVGRSAFLVKYLGLTAATVGVLFKSQSLIKEFVGTN